MRRGIALIALALAIVMVGAGTWALLPGEGTNDPAPGGDDDDDDEQNGNDPPKDDDNGTVALVPHPVDIDPGEAKLSLSLSFPGQGEEGTEYLWDQPYDFVLTTASDGWAGRAVVKVFAEKSGEIGPKCLVAVLDGSGAPIEWHLNEVHGNNHVSGDAFVWMANGTAERTDHLWVTFNRTGTFLLTFQAFEAASGAPLSVAVGSGPCEVPVTGGLAIRALGGGEWRTVDNVTYFAVLLNVTNGWNIRYTVDARYLVLSDGRDEVTVTQGVTAFTSQSLAAGQSTQFLAFFLVEGDGEDLELVYAEPGRPPIDIPLE